jgi:hypothetical protein
LDALFSMDSTVLPTASGEGFYLSSMVQREKDVLDLVRRLIENVAKVNGHTVIDDRRRFSPITLSASIPGSGPQIGTSMLIAKSGSLLWIKTSFFS